MELVLAPVNGQGFSTGTIFQAEGVLKKDWNLRYYVNTGSRVAQNFTEVTSAESRFPFNALISAANAYGNGVVKLSYVAWADVDRNGLMSVVVPWEQGFVMEMGINPDAGLLYFRNSGAANTPRFDGLAPGDFDPGLGTIKGFVSGDFSPSTLRLKPSFTDWDHDGLVDLFANDFLFKSVGTSAVMTMKTPPVGKVALLEGCSKPHPHPHSKCNPDPYPKANPIGGRSFRGMFG